MFGQQISKNVLLLHFTVLIWGFTGVLGEIISISALPLVWYRVVIASIALLIYFGVRRETIAVSKRQILQCVGVGCIVAIHWFLFFQSIKVSKVSVGLVCLSSVTLFTAILEPIFTKAKMSKADVFVGLVIIIGIYLIFTFEFEYFWGIVCGISSAFCASVFSILNAKMVKKMKPTIITLYEMIGAVMILSVALLFQGDILDTISLDHSDLFFLLILGVGCTAVAYVLGVAVMRELSAFSVALVTNLEPVYGIVLALMIFGQREAMSAGFYVGALIVLSAVFAYPYLKTKWHSKRVLAR